MKKATRHTVKEEWREREREREREKWSTQQEGTEEWGRLCHTRDAKWWENKRIMIFTIKGRKLQNLKPQMNIILCYV